MASRSEPAPPKQGLDLLAPANYTPDSSTINVDLVAVPGLGADPSKSFGSETASGFNWLKDEREGIRSEIPGARVLLYHYESRWMGDQSRPQTLYNAASMLLDSLVEKRSKGDGAEASRPLVFLAHSMGGLVVAKALTLAAARPEKIEHMRIYECFAGGIFFGTPFRGTSDQAKAFLLATYLEKVGRGIPTELLNIVKPENDALEELRGDFINLAFKEPRANIACIFEEHRTNYLREKVSKWVPKKFFDHCPEEIVVTQDSAKIDGAIVRGMACDHRQLNRFDSAKDGRYEIVRHHLKDIVKNSQLVVKARLRASRHSVVDDNTFQQLSESLNVVDFLRKRRSAESLSGSSLWILEEQKYLYWRTQTNGNQYLGYPSLWLSGDEGLGKTKAATTVLDDLKKVEAASNAPGARNVMVAYFFCDSTPDCSAAENMLKSLMWQLILKRRSLAQYVKTFASKRSGGGHATEGQFPLSKLWKGLTEMLRDPSVQEVYFVINSIHYLSTDNPSTTEFLTNIAEVLETEPGTNEDPVREKVRWLFLSRDRRSIKDVLSEGHLPGTLRIDLNATSMSEVRRQNARSFTHGRVKELAAVKDYSLALQYFVFSCLERRAQSSTLWVDVVCGLLEALPTNFVQVRKKLELLPQDVEDLIHRTWCEELDDDKDEIEVTKEILRTLAIAYEEPTLHELAVLAELDVFDDPENSEDCTENKIRKHIQDCGPLIRVYDTENWDEEYGYTKVTRVSFIHPLAKDALLRPEMRKLIGLGGEDDDITEVQWQHGILGLRCFSHILKELGAEDDDPTLLKREAPAEDPMEAELNELFPEAPAEESDDDDVEVSALEYALKYWLRHGHEATPDFVQTLDIKHGFWSLESTARKRWWGSFAKTDGQSELKNMTALHIAAFFGLIPLVNSLLADGHAKEIHTLDSLDNQPLHWAAARGHVDVCARLLEEGAEMNNGVKTRVWTPLHMAAAEDRVEVIQFLLDYEGKAGPAYLDAVADEVGTALTLAISWRQTKAAEYLLERGANPTLAAENSEPPVAIAVLRGYEDLVQKLLQIGGAENLASQEYGTALAAAASTGNINIVQMLLGLDNDPDSRKRALEEAAAGGFAAVVESILRTSSGLPFDRAIELAGFYGHDQIIRLLWAYREYDILTQQGINTALYQATDAQQESTINILLRECQADPNSLGEEYGNALTASAFDGTTSILQTLIQFGARIDTAEGFALQAAAANGHTEIVKILLDRGANVNAFTNRTTYGTALQGACVAGHVETTRLLLSRRANPDYGAGDFTNPLTAATSNGYGQIVEMLLQAGANPNVQGGSDNSTPLINAACTLQARYLIPLIQHGAEVDKKDPDEDTALIASAMVGDSDCVKVLLDHGADVNLSGQHHGTALHAAAAYGHEDTCRVLLERGADVEVHAGPFYTVLQAAACSGNSDCVKVILEHDKDLDVDVQGGKHFTALHAAAEQENDRCLRQLLERGAKVDVFPSKLGSNSHIGTPLERAAISGCNRNARLLLEAEADPNIVAGKYGTALQAAALKGDVSLCRLLLSEEAHVDTEGGKYGSALAAAVARNLDYDVLDLFLEQETFPPEAYKAALEMALKLRRKEDFKRILTSMQEIAKKDVKKFPNVKGMMAQFKKAQAAQRKRTVNATVDQDDDVNSDFGDDVVYNFQDIDDEIEESEPEDSTGQNEGTLAGGDESSADYQQTGTRGFNAQSSPSATRGINDQSSSGATRGGNEGWQQDVPTRSRGFGPGEDGGPYQGEQAGGNSTRSRGGAIAAGTSVGAGAGAAGAYGYSSRNDNYQGRDRGFQGDEGDEEVPNDEGGEEEQVDREYAGDGEGEEEENGHEEEQGYDGEEHEGGDDGDEEEVQGDDAEDGDEYQHDDEQQYGEEEY